MTYEFIVGLNDGDTNRPLDELRLLNAREVAMREAAAVFGGVTTYKAESARLDGGHLVIENTQIFRIIIPITGNRDKIRLFGEFLRNTYNQKVVLVNL
jgi:hypothetical protein